MACTLPGVTVMKPTRRQARFFYGWVVVATSAFGLLFGAFPIVVSCFAIFFKAYIREFHASRAAVSLALTIHNIVATGLATWIGRLTDRYGGRTVILPGLGILGLVLLAAQTIGSNIWQLYIFYALLGAVSGTTTSIPYGVVVSRWFNRRRGLALGLSMVGLGVGAIVVPPVVQSLTAGYGWRSAFAIVGGAILIVPMPVIGLFLKEAPQAMGLLPDGAGSAPAASGQPEGLTWREIRNSPTFWLMIVAFVLASAGIAACIVHVAALLSDHGATAATAALAVSVSGLALLVGRAGTGFFLDRFFAPYVAMIILAMAASGIALLWTGATGAPALTGAFLVGLGFGAEVDIIAFLTGRYFGLRAMGTAFGFAFGAFVLSSGLGPLMMGLAFDRTGSYRTPLAGFFFATVIAIALIGRLGPYRFAVKPESQAAAGMPR
jgi:MFS family permease